MRANHESDALFDRPTVMERKETTSKNCIMADGQPLVAIAKKTLVHF